MGKIKQMIAYRLRMCRLMRGMTQQEVGLMVKKTINAVSNWENGNTSPSIDDLVRLCEIYEVTPNQLIGYDACPELDSYIKKTDEVNRELISLEKQREEIEKKIKMYNDMLSHK